MYLKLSQHLETNNLIYKHQYGFSRNKTTEHALIHILNSKYCIGIFLDLKKAFDTVPHNILLLKLEKMGITGTELLWFSYYLSNRTQINGTLSESANLDMSVFQGTILGPTLFSCFINDLPNCTDLLTVLYADTTGLNTLMARASSELTKMAQWFQANKMSLNTSKTKYINFHAPGKKVNSDIALHIDENTPYTPHDPGRVTTVERIHSRHPEYNSQAFKLLGIYLHEHLNFNHNTTQLSNKLSKANFFLNRVKHTLSPRALKSLYLSFFHSHLLYCATISTHAPLKATSPIYSNNRKKLLGTSLEHNI